MNLAIVYGSTFGDTADAAERIAAAFEELTGYRPPLLDVAYIELKELEAFNPLVVGCSTWNIGELQADWDDKFADLDKLNLQDKRVALFGAGDQLGYPDTFQDALGILADKFEALGASVKGLWPTHGYEHMDSLGQRGDNFVGLALDYTSQEEMTQSRIERWVLQLIEEFSLIESLAEQSALVSG